MGRRDEAHAGLRMTIVRGLGIAACCAPLLASAAAAAQSAPAYQSQATTLQSYDGRAMTAEIVRIPVPERRAQPGRTIALVATRIPTTAAHPGSPIVFLMGGPGIPGAVMAPIPPYFSLFQRLSELGDVIVLDQRGIGMSEPPLDCPNSGKPGNDLFLKPGAFIAYTRRQVALCAAHWRQQSADPTAYTTLESADDLDDLRRALGYEKISLLGFSYGTRLALAYVQRHDAHVDRIVLQGVNGSGQVIKLPMAAVRKLERIDALLDKDPAWHPPVDLLAAARKARARLKATPASVVITDRGSEKPVRLEVSREGFDEIVALNLNDTRLPALLLSVAAGDDRVLTQLVDAAWNGIAGGTPGLMARAVDCSADRPRSRWELVKKQAKSAPFGIPVDDEVLTDDFCRAVGFDAPVVEFANPVHSQVPALLLTGTLDATTPVENAQEVARGLPGAVLLDVENAAHEALPETAVQNVVVDFFRGVDVRGRTLVADPPRFMSIEEAAKPRQQRRG
jgi:pimeloyl-ACP methyl ester carboxylesterase